MAAEAHRRYAEILKDVEHMVDDYSEDALPLLTPASVRRMLTTAVLHQKENRVLPSKLKLLVPSAGPFFTRLPLEDAFKYQDRKRYISSRRYVAPSFNDVRLVLNTAQVLAVARGGGLQLATFDGDVTLYDDGMSLEPTSPIVPRLIGNAPFCSGPLVQKANAFQTSCAATSRSESSRRRATPLQTSTSRACTASSALSRPPPCSPPSRSTT